jgi:hypothetical protein
MDDFRPISLGDRDFFAAHYAKYPQVHSDNTFTNMACWNHYAHYQYTYVNGSILITSTIEGVTRFRPPIGPRDPELMADVLRLAKETGDCAPMVLIDGQTAEWMRTTFPSLDLLPDRDHFEYVYRAQDLAELPNGMFHSTRRQLNKFRKNYAYTVEPITVENSLDVKEFLVKWCEWKQCDGDPVLENEKDAVIYAVDHFAELKLSGLLIRVGGRIGAMSIFERLNADTALVHFEKGLEDHEGIYKAINAETAAVLARDFEFINRESDMGVPGLREAKTRYHPHHMVEVYTMRNRPDDCDGEHSGCVTGPQVSRLW